MNLLIYRANEDEEGVAQLYWIDGRIPINEEINRLVAVEKRHLGDKERADILRLNTPTEKYLIVLQTSGLYNLHWKLALSGSVTPERSTVLHMDYTEGPVGVYGERMTPVSNRMRHRARDPSLQSYVVWFAFKTPQERQEFDGEMPLKEMLDRLGFDYKSVESSRDAEYEHEIKKLIDDMILPWQSPAMAAEIIAGDRGFRVDNPGDYI